jgi:hypothetical protein
MLNIFGLRKFHRRYKQSPNEENITIEGRLLWHYTQGGKKARLMIYSIRLTRNDYLIWCSRKGQKVYFF